MNANPNHPELREGEFFLGNFTRDDWTKVGWRTKRCGVNAYCVDGSPYPFQALHGVAPGFALRSENPQKAAEVEAELQ